LIGKAGNIQQIGEPFQLTVSIIVVNYNSGTKLSRCLKSVNQTKLVAETEVIVVDNASTDGSADIVDKKFPGITLIRNHKNLGYGAGNNIGAAHAKGKYLAFLNPDTVIQSDWLISLVATLESNTRIGLVTSKILMINQPGMINACGNDVHISGLTLCRGFGKSNKDLNQLEEVCAVSGAAFLIRSNLYNMLGGFDEDFFLYMEDTDISIRSRLLGYKCYFVPDSVVYHDYVLNFSKQKTFFLERNRHLMLLKSFRIGTIMVLFPILLLAEIVTWGYILLKDTKNYYNKINAYIWILNNLNIMIAKRRTIQNLRRISDREILKLSLSRLEFEQTGDGLLADFAHFIFDPLFGIFQRMVLLLVRW